MRDSAFAPEYAEETAQGWMDKLNMLYVAFTRAESNLFVIAKYKKNLTGVTNTGDLLQTIVPSLSDGTYDDQLLRYTSTTSGTEFVETIEGTNPLKQQPESKETVFVSEEFQTGQSIFKQSNNSREFVNSLSSGAKTTDASHRIYGNVMHKVFEYINHPEDIESALDLLITEGTIHPQQKQEYTDNIKAAIRESQVEDWFSNHYNSYREYTILTKEGEEVVSKRPDRVLLSETETIVIDYKFAEPHPKYHKQVKQYIALLQDMGLPHVKGYLWYVKEHQKVEVH
jgi:ATP-dependent exoDNAse (exonuclease V) beta subunit